MSFPLSKYSLSDLEGYNFLELFNTPVQTENPTPYVNPKELDHNDDATSKPIKTQLMKSTTRNDCTKENPQKQDRTQQPITTKDSIEAIPKDSLQIPTKESQQTLDVPNDKVDITPDKKSVDQPRKIEPEKINDEIAEKEPHMCQFAGTKDHHAKVLVIPMNQHQILSNSSNYYPINKDQPVDKLYSVIHPSGGRVSPKLRKKQKTKVATEIAPNFPPTRTYSKSVVPTNPKEKLKENSYQPNNENGRVDKKLNLADLVPLRVLRKNRKYSFTYFLTLIVRVDRTKIITCFL